MRITSSLFYTNSINDYQRNLQELDKVNKQIASGAKIQNSFEDSGAFIDTMRLNSEIATLEQAKETSTKAQTFANNTDGLLNEFSSSLDLFKDKLLQAANASNSQTSLTALANDLTGIKDHLISLANTSINGQYLLAGSALTVKPMSDDGTYNGNNETMKALVGSGVQIPYNIDGQSLFLGNDTDYSRKLSTNVKMFNQTLLHPDVMNGTSESSKEVFLNKNDTIRDMIGDSDSDTANDPNSMFYLSGRKPNGDTFSSQIEMNGSTKISALMDKIGYEFGNTSTNTVVEVNMNEHGQIEIQDLKAGNKLLEMNIFGAVDRKASAGSLGTVANSNSINELMGLSDIQIIQFQKSDFKLDNTASSITSKQDIYSPGTFTLGAPMLRSDGTPVSTTDTLQSFMGEDTNQIVFSGKNNVGISVSPILIPPNDVLRIEKDTTVADLLTRLESVYGLPTRIEAGQIYLEGEYDTGVTVAQTVLTADLVDGDTISTTINGNTYSATFDAENLDMDTHAKVMEAFALSISNGESDITAIFDGTRTITATADSLDSVFTLNTDYDVTHLLSGVTPEKATIELSTDLIDGDTLSIDINGASYAATFSSTNPLLDTHEKVMNDIISQINTALSPAIATAELDLTGRILTVTAGDNNPDTINGDVISTLNGVIGGIAIDGIIGQVGEAATYEATVNGTGFGVASANDIVSWTDGTTIYDSDVAMGGESFTDMMASLTANIDAAGNYNAHYIVTDTVSGTFNVTSNTTEEVTGFVGALSYASLGGATITESAPTANDPGQSVITGVPASFQSDALQTTSSFGSLSDGNTFTCSDGASTAVTSTVTIGTGGLTTASSFDDIMTALATAITDDVTAVGAQAYTASYNQATQKLSVIADTDNPVAGFNPTMTSSAGTLAAMTYNPGTIGTAIAGAGTDFSVNPLSVKLDALKFARDGEVQSFDIGASTAVGDMEFTFAGGEFYNVLDIPIGTAAETALYISTQLNLALPLAAPDDNIAKVYTDGSKLVFDYLDTAGDVGNVSITADTTGAVPTIVTPIISDNNALYSSSGLSEIQSFEIKENLSTILGDTVDFAMLSADPSYDINLTFNENNTPIDIATNIATAVQAVIDTNINGSFFLDANGKRIIAVSDGLDGKVTFTYDSLDENVDVAPISFTNSGGSGDIIITNENDRTITQGSGILSANAFKTFDAMNYEQRGFEKNGSTLSSNISQVVRDTNTFATSKTKVSEVSGIVPMVDTTLAFNFTNSSGDISMGEINLSDTSPDFSTFKIDFDNSGTYEPNETIPLFNASGEATKGSEVTYQQLSDVLSLALSGQHPIDKDVVDSANANAFVSLGDGNIFEEYQASLKIAKANVDVNLDDKGQLVVNDKRNTNTKIELALFDASSNSFDKTAGFSFMANDAVKIDDPSIDFFQNLNEMIDSVRTGQYMMDSETGDPRNIGIENSIARLDHIADHVAREHTKIGSYSNSLLSAQQRVELLSLNIQITRSQVADVDMGEALIKFNQISNSYQAMLSTVAKINSMTLLNYL